MMGNVDSRNDVCGTYRCEVRRLKKLRRQELFMSRTRRVRIRKGLVFMIALALLLSQASSVFAQQALPSAKSQQPQVKAEPEKIIPSPQNIKESTAIVVFLVWMWISIAVLIYFLRLKIKEVDRLYTSRFFSPDKK